MSASTSNKGYTAVIYFHGMGSQRRYEETSRLVDAIDRAVSTLYARKGRPGFLRGVDLQFEENRDPEQADVGYLNARHFVRGRPSDDKALRFYEVYWADVMADARSVWVVFGWIVAQVIRPIKTAITPWRERRRLRLSSLLELEATPRNWPKGTQATDFNALRKLYDNYDGNQQRRVEAPLRNRGAWGLGRFRRFLAVIEASDRKSGERAKGLTTLAKRWIRTYRLTEAKNFVVLLSMLLSLGLMALLFAWLLISIGGYITFLVPDDITLPDWATGSWQNALSAGGTLLVSGLLSGFLVKRMADVEAWSTYRETNALNRKRAQVLDRASTVLSHVLNDPECKRAVVVAHSLGTSVAYDSLLHCTMLNKANSPSNPMQGRMPLDKISHFFTFGSPIDKIEYFFESFRTPHRRYRRAYEQLRGDAAKPPFRKTGRSINTRWINFWDEADVISGPIHSPNAIHNRPHAIENVTVRSYRQLSPGKAHNGYLDNLDVVEPILEAVIHNAGAYNTDAAPRVPGSYPNGELGPVDFDAMALPPGPKTGYWRIELGMLILAPWAWATFAAMTFLGATSLAPGALTAALFLTGTPLASALLYRRPGLSNPLD